MDGQPAQVRYFIRQTDVGDDKPGCRLERVPTGLHVMVANVRPHFEREHEKGIVSTTEIEGLRKAPFRIMDLRVPDS